MFMHACVNMTLKRIKASSRETNPWKNISHEKNSETDMDVSV
jgi:hypothetical protein